MGLGPFATFVFPGVFTRTLTEANISNLVAGLRIPVYIGVGQEELEQLDLELVRGSSSTLDEQIVNEDVTLSFVVDETNVNNPILGATDGTLTKVRVRNFPIVDGQGFGRVSNDVRSVSATVNGSPVALGSVQGTKGYVVFQVPPQATDIVRVTYYFHRGDTVFTDDVSDQVTPTTAYLVTPGYAPFTFTAGSTNVFVINVNGSDYTITFAGGTFTAASVKGQIDMAAISGLSTSVFTDEQGRDHVQLNAAVGLEIKSGTANGPLGFSQGDKTSRNAAFRVYNIPIVDGSGGGSTTTDPTKVVVLVNGAQVVASAVDGRNGIVTLPNPPIPGSTVTVRYYANTWQDTFDYLPNTLVTGVIRCGISAGRNDYIEGQDFVISNPSTDTSIIHWGTSYVVTSTQRTAGAEPFDSSQIVPTLVDDRLYMALCTRVTNTATIPATVSSNEFILPEVPTMGNGRDTPLGTTLYNDVANSRYGLASARPDLVQVWVGRSLRDALQRGRVTVTSVDPTTLKVTLKNAVPPDFNAYATFWYNRVTDDTFILTNKVAGPVGTGQYEVFSSTYAANLYQVRFGTKGGGLTEIVQWPRGVEQIPDAFHHGGTPVSEVITVTFGTAPAANAAYTNKGASPYSLYSGTSSSWTTGVNGASVLTNLATAAKGFLIGAHVTPIQSGVDAGDITIPASPSNVLTLVIDGTTITAPITAGNRTPTQIVTDINAAIDADPAFSGTAPNTLAGFKQIGPATGDVIFYVQSYSTPGALPDGFDHTSTVMVGQGTIEATLGFTTYQSAQGTTGAINKPSSYLGTKVGPFNITAGLNDTLMFRLNGIDYEITLPNGAAVAASAIVTAINSTPGLTGVASTNTIGAHAGMIRLTSTTNNDTSSVSILSGSANDILGFTSGDFAGQVRVTAQEIANLLNSTVGFFSGAIAYADTISGQTYITIESITVGATASSISFVSSAGTAFNRTTGLNITPGTDGDVGEDAYNNYTITSNNPLGSAGTGIPGQTYTDARTGLRFSILPALTGTYGAGTTVNFTMEISPTFIVNPAVPTYALPGLETIVTNTVNVGINDTATVQTFNPSGVEPAVGDFYFLSYRYMKQDFTTRIYRAFKNIEANFGRISAENRVTLAAYLAILNGAVLVGIKQVLKVVNTNQANDASFISAIKELEIPLPGGVKPDIIVPLATSSAVYAYLTQHCEVMSNERNQSERMGFIGFASGTIPSTAQTVAKSLVSNRIIALYPDSAVITMTNELGESFEALVDGTFFAAAVSGAAVSPAVDVATPYTRRRIQGFTRVPRILDAVEASQTAVSGVTLLEDLDPIIRIRQGLTTNMATILTRLPTVTQIADHVQQQSRMILDSFVGTKFLPSRTNEVEVTMTGLFKSLIQAEIIAAFTGVSATVDTDDPTILRFDAYYQPIFPLLYLVLTFNIRARI
jgi:hypothetical protein